MIEAALFALLVSAIVLLAWIDLGRGIIPDWLNLSIAVLGLARAVLLDGWEPALGPLSKAFSSARSFGCYAGSISWRENFRASG
jgi:hypothetical protein